MLRRLILREAFGEIRASARNRKEEIFYQLPLRLIFPLFNIIPKSALSSGHIFLGFTKCGQFLLSYTHSFDTDDLTLQVNHRFLLHWWLFVPYHNLRKVAEVTLFGDNELKENICENMFISVCQWPNDLSKLLIYGCCLPTDNGCATQTRSCYVTITAVPSLNRCTACSKIATSFEEEDLAERWNGCARFSCLKHGVTVHTSFEMVPPFSNFLPSIQLKKDNQVVLNSGNFVHVLSIRLENIHEMDTGDEKAGLRLWPKCYIGPPSFRSEESVSFCDINRSIESEVNISLENIYPVLISESEEESDKLIPNSYDSEDTLLHNSADELFSPKMLSDFEMDAGSPSCVNIQNLKPNVGDVPKGSSGPNLHNFSADSDTSQEESPCKHDYNCGIKCYSQEFVENRENIENIYSHMQQRQVELKYGSSSSGKFNSSVKTRLAEKEYDFVDEISDLQHEKLSVFRRKRLADRKYEFSDENFENIPANYRSFRKEKYCYIKSPSYSPRFRSVQLPYSFENDDSSNMPHGVHGKVWSPSYGSEVLRPISQNVKSPVMSPREDFEVINKNIKCVADICRRYVEMDDELMSVITDTEDDDVWSTTGYHNALPLSVHGAGYVQMHMISNSKAEKLGIPNVCLHQISLDVEQLCHETAQKLCTDCGMKYFFCSDYNIEMIDVCPSSGNIVASASFLLKASDGALGAKTSSSSLSLWGSLRRKYFHTRATFVFNTDTKQYTILDSEPLKEHYMPNVKESHEVWWKEYPRMAFELRKRCLLPTDYYSSVKVLTNEAYIKGKSLSYIMEKKHLVALVLGGLST